MPKVMACLAWHAPSETDLTACPFLLSAQSHNCPPCRAGLGRRGRQRLRAGRWHAPVRPAPEQPLQLKIATIGAAGPGAQRRGAASGGAGARDGAPGSEAPAAGGRFPGCLLAAMAMPLLRSVYSKGMGPHPHRACMPTRCGAARPPAKRYLPFHHPPAFQDAAPTCHRFSDPVCRTQS